MLVSQGGEAGHISQETQGYSDMVDYLGIAGDLEKQAICFSCPATDTSTTDTFTLNVFLHKDVKPKKVSDKSTKNGMKETKTSYEGLKQSYTDKVAPDNFNTKSF